MPHYVRRLAAGRFSEALATIRERIPFPLDCGYCKQACGLNVFSRSNAFNAGGYRPYVAANAENCIGRLRCLYICPDFAIEATDLRGSVSLPARPRFALC